MPCVNRPLILLAFISLLWVPRLHAETHFSSCVDGTGNIFNATVVVTEQSLSGWTGGSLAPGSEIAVFSTDPNRVDFCVGTMTWSGATGAIAIWGNDSYSPTPSGLNPGEGFYFRIFDSATNAEYGNEFFGTSFSVGNSHYTQDGVYVTDAFTSLQVTTSVSVPMRKGWNLVGIDRDVDDSNYQTLFPSAVEQTLFRFDGNYVQQSDATLSAGVGYWLRMESAADVVIEGVARKSVTLDLRSGWNLISGPGCAYRLDDAPDPDGVLISNTMFQFNGSYSAATELSPGRSYWVRAAKSGSIDITCPEIASRVSGPTNLGNENSGLVSSFSSSALSFGKNAGSASVSGSALGSAAGSGSASVSGSVSDSGSSSGSGSHSQSAVAASLAVSDRKNTTIVRLGVHPDASDLFETGFDLLAPPIPPVGAFDARSRIGSEDFLTDIRSSTTGEQVFTLMYQSELDQGSIVLRWDPSELSELGEYHIVDNVTGSLFGPLDMSTIDSLDVSSAGGTLSNGLRIIYKSSVVFAPAEPELVEPQLFAQDVPTITSFSWAESGAARYHIQITTVSDPAFSAVSFEDSTLTSASVEFGGLDVNTQYIWRLRAANSAGFGDWSSIAQFTTSSVQSTPVDEQASLPESVSLGQNYPNPFNPSTTIGFDLSSAQNVSLTIYDMTGREVQKLVNENRAPGHHEVRWNASRFSSGAYIYRLQVGSRVKTKTMMLMK